MSTKKRAQLDALMDQIEEMWAHLATLFEGLNATNGWGQKHGPDWTFADVPYHLAYINRDVVIRGLELGPDMPETEQELLASPEEINAWNDHKFAERPADQTVAQSLAQWQATCEDIRRLASEMDDADLEHPFWLPALMGWVTARDGLALCHIHDWSEFTQLRLHLGRTKPLPSPAITRGYLGAMLNFMPMFLNQEAATGQQFTAVMAFTDPDVGAWTMYVTDGAATVSEGETAAADLMLTQSAETFEKSLRRMHNPAEAIQAGEIQVSNFERLATFGQLFPM